MYVLMQPRCCGERNCWTMVSSYGLCRVKKFHSRSLMQAHAVAGISMLHISFITEALGSAKRWRAVKALRSPSRFYGRGQQHMKHAWEWELGQRGICQQLQHWLETASRLHVALCISTRLQDLRIQDIPAAAQLGCLQLSGQQNTTGLRAYVHCSLCQRRLVGLSRKS